MILKTKDQLKDELDETDALGIVTAIIVGAFAAYCFLGVALIAFN
jgi:hypothetical protein